MSGRAVVMGMIVLGVSLGTLAFFFAPRVRLRPAEPPELPVVAVLPFANRSADPELELVASTIGEAVARELASSGRVRTVSSRASLMFKDVEGGLGRVAAELDADYVIAGSLERDRSGTDRSAERDTGAGVRPPDPKGESRSDSDERSSGLDVVRVDAYLYRAGVDEAIWAERLEWAASDTDSIAPELAQRIAGSLSGRSGYSFP